MKPYYADSAVTLYHGDCLEIIPSVGDVDHVITDPPYDSKTHKGAVLEQAIDFAPLADLGVLVPSLIQASRRWVVCFCSLEMLDCYRRASGDAWIRAGIWDRIVNMPQMSGDRPAQGGEGVAIMHRGGRKKWNGGGKAAIWRHDVERGHKQHPTQKPLHLFTEIISQFTDTGDTILDPFAGSGTTGRSCKDLGRKCVMIEREERYCEIAARRMSQEVLPLEGAA